MDSPEQSRGYTKWDLEDAPDVKSDRAGDDDDCDGADKRKHRSSRSKKSGNGEEVEGLDGSGRRKSNGDRNESRKKSSSTTKADSEEEDYDSRKELRSKQSKKKLEESSLDKLCSWYGEAENKQDGGEKATKKGQDRVDESDRRKSALKNVEQESSHGKSKRKEENSHDEEHDKSLDKDHGREKIDSTRNSRRRWDETDGVKTADESNSEKADARSSKTSNSKYESPKSKSASTRNETSESRSKGSNLNTEKATKLSNREERKADADRSKSKGRSETVEEGGKGSPNREKPEKHKQQRSSEHSDMDYERSSKRKEIEKDGYKDDRSKGRDENWSERSSRDREGSKESWKRRQSSGNDIKEAKNGEPGYEHGRDWEIPRHSRDSNDRLLGRSGNRKDGNRGEAVKTSSNFGISNENYDVIEIQTKPLDYGRTESGSKSDVKAASNDEDDRSRKTDYSSGNPVEDSKERYLDDNTPLRDQNSRRDDFDFHGGKGRGQKSVLPSPGRNVSSQNSGGSSQPPYGTQESYNRNSMQGLKGSRFGRGGRGRPSGRDHQQLAMPLPLMASPFGPLGIPPGPLQSLTPSMSPAPGPPMSPNVFIPPFSPPVWAVPPGPSGPSGPRFPTNLSPANAAMYFNQSGSVRGPANISGPPFNASSPMGRLNPGDKTPGGWVPSKSNGPPGKAPSRGEQNDYSQNFVDTGMRPQNFIRELELTNVVEDYPKLRELIQKKDEIVANSASAPMYHQCDLKEFELSPDFFGTKFDVILVDPPWEEYVHRAPGVADHMEYWTLDEIMNLKIEAIADTPSFIFLWVGDGVGLEQGRQCLKKWGFRRCEDICWVKTNKGNAAPGLRHDSHTLFQHSKEHCLMGIKGTVRRSTDGHIIHANIDTDVIIAEEPPYGSTQKPEDMYRIVEHFALGRRRLELFGEDHNIRAGWLTVGKGLSSSNYNSEAYTRSFSDKDGKVWQGGGGRNPPPEAPHLVVTTPEIESLRPKSPMKNQQQQQQQPSSSISLSAASSSNRRATGNSPQNMNPMGGINPEASSNLGSVSPWVVPMEGFKGRDGNLPPDDKVFEAFGYGGRAGGEFVDFESQRPLNLN